MRELHTMSGSKVQTFLIQKYGALSKHTLDASTPASNGRGGALRERHLGSEEPGAVREEAV